MTGLLSLMVKSISGKTALELLYCNYFLQGWVLFRSEVINNMVISFDDPNVPAANGDNGDKPTEGDAPAEEGAGEDKPAE